MLHNRRKRVTDVTVGKSESDIWIVLEIDRDEVLYVETRDLTINQAEVLGDGYVNGFEYGECLAPNRIETLVNDPVEMAALQIPSTVSPSDRGLFRRGRASGLELVASGYWLDRPGTPEYSSKA